MFKASKFDINLDNHHYIALYFTTIVLITKPTMFQSSDIFSGFPTSSAGELQGSKLNVSNINTQVEQVPNSQRSPASLSGRTSQNGDSDAEDLSMFGPSGSSEDDPLSKKFEASSLNEKAFFDLPTHSTLFHGLEESTDSKSTMNFMFEQQSNSDRSLFFHNSSRQVNESAVVRQ